MIAEFHINIMILKMIDKPEQVFQVLEYPLGMYVCMCMYINVYISE